MSHAYGMALWTMRLGDLPWLALLREYCHIIASE